MTKNDAVAMLKKLRCLGCSRAPSGFEVLEMYASFGKKLAADDAGKLRWRCKACLPS